MKAQEAAVALSGIAESQRGLVTSRQAALVGVPRLTLARLEDAGTLDRITHAVYRMGGAPRDEHELLRANWLALDPGRTAAERLTDKQHMIAVSHRSAAQVHGIGNLYADDNRYTANYRKQSTRDGVKLSHRPLGVSDVRVEAGMLVTTPERTIADLARTEPDESHVADVLGDAIDARKTTRDKVVARLPGRSLTERERAVDRMLAYNGIDTKALAARLAESAIGADAMVEVAHSITASALEEYRRITAPMLAEVTSALGAAAVDEVRKHAMIIEQVSRIIEPISAAYAERANILATIPWLTLQDVASISELTQDTHDE